MSNKLTVEQAEAWLRHKRGDRLGEIKTDGDYSWVSTQTFWGGVYHETGRVTWCESLGHGEFLTPAECDALMRPSRDETEPEVDYAVRLLRHELRDLTDADFDAFLNPDLEVFRADLAEHPLLEVVETWRAYYYADLMGRANGQERPCRWLADQLAAAEAARYDVDRLGAVPDSLYRAVTGVKS